MILNLVTTLVSLQLVSLITCFLQSRGRKERVCSVCLRFLPNFLRVWLEVKFSAVLLA